MNKISFTTHIPYPQHSLKLSHFQSNSLLISYQLLSCVSISTLPQSTAPPSVQHPKKKKIHAGLPPRACLAIGNTVLMVATVSQFTIVEYGMMFGCTIQEMYIQITGPRVKENTSRIAIRVMQTKTFGVKPLVVKWEQSILLKHCHISSTSMPLIKLPYCILRFLPNILNTGIHRNPPKTARLLIKIGNTLPILGKICPTISPEYTMMGPMPTICWDIDSIQATNFANGFVVRICGSGWARRGFVVGLSRFVSYCQWVLGVLLVSDDSLWRKCGRSYSDIRCESLSTCFIAYPASIAFFSSSYTSPRYSSLQITSNSSLSSRSRPLSMSHLGVSQGNRYLKLYNCIHEVTMGKANTMRQYCSGERNRESRNVRQKENVMPITMPIWFQGQRDEASQVGESYRMKSGATALIMPMQIPCKHRASKSAPIQGTCRTRHASIIPHASTSRHLLRLYAPNSHELQKAPNPPRRETQPVSRPCMVDW